MKTATLSLTVTAVYLLIVAYAADVARVLGPVYVVVVLLVFWAGRKEESRRARS